HQRNNRLPKASLNQKRHRRSPFGWLQNPKKKRPINRKRRQGLRKTWMKKRLNRSRQLLNSRLRSKTLRPQNRPNFR
ncbi:MAG: hypothetical protein VXZ99_07660, partial [Pseudomonadota bacterium]|nr:hypothetical protein [Pseudomonadota bacterium]